MINYNLFMVLAKHSSMILFYDIMISCEVYFQAKNGVSLRPWPGDMKTGDYVGVNVTSNKGRTILFVAGVCSVKGRKVTLKYLTKTGTSGVYRDPETKCGGPEVSGVPLPKPTHDCGWHYKTQVYL